MSDESPNIYRLSRAVEAGGATWTQVTLPDELLGRHAEAMDSAKGEMRKVHALIGAACGIPVAVVREFPMRDIKAISERLLAESGAADFLELGEPATA